MKVLPRQELGSSSPIRVLFTTIPKPVIATNGGGVPEIVEDGKTGILVPMGDVQAMAAGISRLLAEPAEMGARGRERARNHFTIELKARRVEAIYMAMFSRSQSSSGEAERQAWPAPFPWQSLTLLHSF
jgi:hypothetical protein